MPEEGNVSEEQVQPATTESQPSDIDIRFKELEEKYDKRLRGLQGAKDQRISALERSLAETVESREELEKRMLEMIDDPAVKAEMVNQHLQARLNRYEQDAKVAQQLAGARSWYVDLGVPRNLLDVITTPEEMQTVAKTYFASREAAVQEASVVTKEDEGADDVVIGTSPSPASNSAPNADYLKEKAELIADKNLKSRDRSRKLLAIKRKYQKNRGVRPRPTV